MCAVYVYCVCVTFVVFTDCESCARPISTNPGSVEAGEYGLARGMCFVPRRLEVVAVAGLLWTSWCVMGAAGSCLFFRFYLRTYAACCKYEYEAVLIHLPLASKKSGFHWFRPLAACNYI